MSVARPHRSSTGFLVTRRAPGCYREHGDLPCPGRAYLPIRTDTGRLHAMADDAGTALFHQSMPLTERLGVEVLEHGPALVRSRITWDETLCTLGGALHGGVLMALADSTAAVCAFLDLPEGTRATTTVESKTNFLRAVRSGHAAASSRPLHTGRSFIVVETEVRDDTGALVAKVTQTQAVR
ncbi:PaaI family thioesterase [Nocardia sp. NPDC003963]